MCYQPFLIATFFIALFIHVANGNACNVTVEKIGCFNDRSRPLDKLLVYRRQTYNYQTQSSDLPSLLCDCAVEAQTYGYHFIGLQYYAECWSSNKTKPSYARDGSSTNRCVNPEFQTCSQNDQVCVGGALANFIYKIVYAGTTQGTRTTTDAPLPSQTPSTVEPSTAGTTKEPCIDRNVDCPRFKSYCSDRYQNMLRHCAKTCEQCK